MTERAPRGTSVVDAVLRATRSLDRDECLSVLAESTVRLFGARAVVAYAVSPTGDDYVAVASAVDPDEAIEEDVLRGAYGALDASLVVSLSADGPARIDAGLLLGEMERERAAIPGTALLVPLVASAGRAGLLLAFLGASRAPRGWRGRAAELAVELAPALDNLRDVELLRELVLRDDTTDCYNRRCLEENLDVEVERSRRFGNNFAIIFLDMDNLKDVNTNHGHAAGSKVLRDAALRIGRSIRSIDRLYRYGGDEFVAILPGTGLAGAREVAERIRRELGSQPFETPTGVRVRLTASTGVAVWPQHSSSGRGVIAAADDAMRRVKASEKGGIGTAAERQDARPGTTGRRS